VVPCDFQRTSQRKTSWFPIIKKNNIFQVPLNTRQNLGDARLWMLPIRQDLLMIFYAWHYRIHFSSCMMIWCKKFFCFKLNINNIIVYGILCSLCSLDIHFPNLSHLMQMTGNNFLVIQLQVVFEYALICWSFDLIMSAVVPFRYNSLSWMWSIFQNLPREIVYINFYLTYMTYMTYNIIVMQYI